MALLAALSACGPPSEARARALADEIRRQIRAGDLNRALPLAERGWAQWRRRPGSVLHWDFRLLYAQVLGLQGKARELLELLADEPPAGEGFRAMRARWMMCLGRARFIEANYPESRRLLQQAQGLAREAGEPLLEAEVLLWLAAALARSGEWRLGDEACRQAWDLAVGHRDVYLETAAVGNRGFIRLNSSRYDEAIPFFEQALELAEKAGARRLVASTLGNLGRCYAGLGEYSKAAPVIAKAASLMAELGDANGQQIWLGSLGEMHQLAGEYEKAISCYREALEKSRRLGAAYFTLLWLNKLTELALERREWNAAEAHNREAARISPRVPTRDAGIWTALWRARLAAHQGHTQQAERGYREVLASASPGEEPGVIWSARAGLADLYARTERSEQAEQQFQLALAALEQTRSRLRRDEWKLSFHAASVRFYQQYVDYLMSRGRSERALEVAESARARLLAQNLGLGGEQRWETPAARFRDLARRFRATLLSFWLAPRGSFLWVVRSERIVSFQLPPEAEIRSLVEAAKGAIEGLRDVLGTESPAALRLWEVLIGPAAALLAPGARIIVVPDGSLYELNLESLVTGRPLRYWIEDVSLAVTPSLSLLAAGQGARFSGRDSLLLIGDPLAASNEYPRLPEAGREMRGILRCFPSSRQVVLTGAAAHPDAYAEARPERFALVHFAAHATANRENPLDSAVILSPRRERLKLYAREVVQIPLQAELVTLSACRGAGGRFYSGEGMVGFAWAFLQAGAGNVIAGLWDVDDASTAALMQYLYAELAAGQPPAEALRAAKRRLIAGGTAWSKPFYWGAFQLYTRTRPF